MIGGRVGHQEIVTSVGPILPICRSVTSTVRPRNKLGLSDDAGQKKNGDQGIYEAYEHKRVRQARPRKPCMEYDDIPYGAEDALDQLMIATLE